MFNVEHERSFGSGMMVGVLVGAGVALLFAPKTGSQLRGDLSGSMSSMRDAIARRYRALADRAGVELENLDERVDQAAEAIESTARDVMEAAGRHRREPSGV
jgi:gas vesicle protein